MSRILEHVALSADLEAQLAASAEARLARYVELLEIPSISGISTHAPDCRRAAEWLVAELRRMKDEPLPQSELQRAKDHLKGSLMLNLESTSSRMSHMARQEIYFEQQQGLDETLQGVGLVTHEDVQRVARDLFAEGQLAATVVGAVDGLTIPAERLSLG